MRLFLLSAIVAILLSFIVAISFTCIVIISPTSIDDSSGINTIGLQISYALPIFIKLLCADPAEFPHTPLSLGRTSSYMGAVAIIWLFSTSIFFFFPTESPVTASNMNYSIVVVGTVIVLGVINWELNSK